jgi:hypothetical protein
MLLKKKRRTEQGACSAIKRLDIWDTSANVMIYSAKIIECPKNINAILISKNNIRRNFKSRTPK